MLRRSGRSITVLFRLLVAPAAVFVVLAAAPSRAEEVSGPVPGEAARYFVKVPHVGPEDVRRLAAEGFDVAGFEAEAGVVGIVGTADELRVLESKGLTYRVESVGGPLDASPFALSDYTDPAEMSAFLDAVQAAYPNLAKKFLLRDDLFEGHVVYAMKITAGVDQPNDRPRFVLDAQHHAREVMTPEIAKDMIDYLTSRYATDPQVRNWVDSIEIWVVPIVNPDGAAHVFTADSSWRRNRHPGCPVDLNRNYEIGWNSCNGSSGSCSSDTFRGVAPGSEPETQAMMQLFSDVHAFFGLSYHSYGQYILYSYGCSNPDEMTVMDGVAQSLNAILVKDNGATGGWLTGPIWSTIYLADGGSSDTAYGRAGTYAFTIEVNTSSFQPDYATWRNVTVQRQRTAWQYFLDKTLQAPQIRGKITDVSSGEPLAAQVAVQQVVFTHGEYPRKADPRGLYHWLVQAGGTYDVTFTTPGYCAETRRVTVGSGPYTLDVAMSFPPSPSTPMAVAAGENRIDLSWSPVAGVSEYRILRSLAPGGPYTQIAAVPAPGTTYRDASVSGGVTYYYVIRSFDACESPDSPETSAATTGACTLGPAFAGVASVTNTAGTTCALSLNWSPAAPYCGGPATYRVYRGTTALFVPSPSNLIAAGLSTTTHTDHAGLAGGTPSYYIVRGVDAQNGAEDANVEAKSGVPTGPYTLGTWSDDAGDTGAAKLIPASPWTVQATGGKNAPRVYATGTTVSNLCAAVASPAVDLGMNASLSFASKYNLETNYDAGVVEIATAPTFTNWTKLTTVNYPNPLPYTGNACGFASNTSATAFSFTYATPAYSVLPYTGSLTGFAGQQVKLRWSVSTDGSINGSGWWIDDVQIANAMIPGACAAGIPPSPAETSAAGSPMLCAYSGTGTSVRCVYAPACGALDTAAFWGTGPIGGALAWTGFACALGTTGVAVFDPGTPDPGSFVYFVLVGHNGTQEGSYGRGFDGVASPERAEATGLGACDRPQVLGGICP